MMSFGAYAAHLRSAATQCRPLLEATLDVEMKALGEMAKALPGPGDPSWPPLSEVTLADKAKRGYGVPDPLLRTGALKGSIQGGAIGLVGMVGSSDRKAVFHEFGTAKMPPRPIYALVMRRHLPHLEAVFNALAVRLLAGSG